MESQVYLNLLNDQQKSAVIHNGKSLLILAGAGSGKTRVITTKIAYMIQEMGIKPYSILAVTFTKKAADEMRTRAVELEERAKYSQIKTFHSFGAFFLRQFAEYAGISSDFTVYDDDDSVSLLVKADPTLQRKDASRIMQQISRAKDLCLRPDSLELDLISSEEKFRTYYERYEKRLRATGNVDFGDLILLPYEILKENEKIRERIHDKFRVVLVDEYQDSNVAQFKLLQQLVGENTYVCVVGDDDQSIYKFRGADIQNILSFQQQFPGTDLIKLEKNYRSTQEILTCANEVIKNNTGRLGKNLEAVKGKGKLPVLVFLPNQDDETDFCCSLIEQAHDKGVPYTDWAILYRTNAQSLGFENEFLRKKIPYTIVGTLKFYEREEIKDIVAWLSFLANPRDEISFRRIVNKPARGIGSKSQDAIVDECLGNSILSGMRDVQLPKKAKEGVEQFCSLCDKFLSSLPSVKNSVMSSMESLALEASDSDDEEKKFIEIGGTTLADFVRMIIDDSGFAEFYKEQDKNADTSKVNNMDELVNNAVLYPCTREGLLEFLDRINLDAAALNDANDEDTIDRVTLITLHNTKGLEYPRVIITGMEQGLFPRDDKTGEELEEERRLFYVGITRAKNELYYTSCSVRRLYGRVNQMFPSQFLSELPKENLKILGDKPSAFKKKTSSEEYTAGTTIFHDDYGTGTVVRGFVGESGEYVIKVLFESGFEKTFIPKFQKKSLQIIK